MGISIITSLYRSATHLKVYVEHVIAVNDALQEVDILLEVVLVANDVTPEEKTILEQLHQIPNLETKILYVSRESLYNSWNRGIESATYDVLGFWNVDDVRTIEAIQQGYQLLQDETIQLVDFPYQLVQNGMPQTLLAQYKPDSFSPKSVASPFFMFHRQLYDQAGGFNPNFRITGDFEWLKRDAVCNANFTLGDAIAGQFILHGNNLSGGNSPLEWVEINIVLLWHGLDQSVRPVDPILMRQTWETWGHEGSVLKPETANWLWGDGAQSRYDAYQKERSQHPLLRRVRLALARRGLLQSVEWDAHHRKL